MIDLDSLSDDELLELDAAVRPRAEAIRVARETASEIDLLAARYLDMTGRQRGEDWMQPTGAHDAYPQGWTVTHNGRQWESLTPANVWEPGISGWREIVPDGGGPAEWM